MSKQTTASRDPLHVGSRVPENERHLRNAVTNVFGDNAALVAAWSALEAKFDGREDECRLWAAVFRHLRQGDA